MGNDAKLNIGKSWVVPFKQGGYHGIGGMRIGWFVLFMESVYQNRLILMLQKNPHIPNIGKF